MLVVLWIVFGQQLTFGHQVVHMNLAMVLGTLALVSVGAVLPGFLKVPKRKYP